MTPKLRYGRCPIGSMIYCARSRKGVYEPFPWDMGGCIEFFHYALHRDIMYLSWCDHPDIEQIDFYIHDTSTPNKSRTFDYGMCNLTEPET